MQGNYYKFFREYKFALVRLQSERLTIPELLQINHDYKSDPAYPDIHYLLIIVDEKSNPEFKVKDLEKLAQIYTQELQPNNHKRVVWLVSEPIITALAYMFISYTNDMYCSTTDRAYELLCLPIEYKKFLELIGSEAETH